MPILLIAGNLQDQTFQEARQIAEDICYGNANYSLEVKAFVEHEWLTYLQKKRRYLGGKALEHGTDPIVVHSILGYMGGVNELFTWAAETQRYEDPRSRKEYQENIVPMFRNLAEKDLAMYVTKSTNSFCYFDMKLGNQSDTKRLVFELYSSKCPKTCENFRALCTGEKGSSESGVKLHYKDSPIHRVVKDAWIQGGDIVDGRGAGGASIYGDTFPDESFTIKHDGAGILAMSNNGPHTNSSQWYITLREMPYLDTKKVAFGRVVCGRDVLTEISQVDTENQRPKDSVLIAGCGEFKPEVVEEKTAEAKAKTKTTKKATVVVIGVDNAGKSTIVNHYIGCPEEPFVMPTNGFDREKCDVGDFNVQIFCLGGAPGIRGYWNNYYDEAHGIIYVVDAADENKIEESTTAFKELLAAPMAAGKPILVYANKQDLDNPLAATEVALKLGLDSNNDTSKIFTSTALYKKESGKIPDSAIMEGLTWLVEAVDKNLPALDARIKVDKAARQAKEKKEVAETKKKFGK